MSSELLHVLVPIVSLTTNALCQVFSCKYASTKNLMKSVFIGFAAGFAGFIPCGYLLARNPISQYFYLLLTNLITYCCLSFCYFVVIGLGVSLRFRILDILSRSSAGLSHEQLAREFDANGLFERRLNRLVESGQVSERNGRFHSVNSVFLILARLNIKVKQFMTGKSSEFD